MDYIVMTALAVAFVSVVSFVVRSHDVERQPIRIRAERKKRFF